MNKKNYNKRMSLKKLNMKMK